MARLAANVKTKLVGQGKIIKKDLWRNWKLYLIFLPVLIYYIIFMYGPMYGALIAFKDFNPMKGIMGSDWVGFYHFKDFFTSPDFRKILFNTLNISISSIIWGFPAPIILALMINEVRTNVLKRGVQTITYMPHFISLVVVCGLIKTFLGTDGFITQLLAKIGLCEPSNMLGNKNYFVPIYVLSGIWQEVGWGSIIYLAALTGISQDLYEAAEVDGAGKWRQLFSITLPSLVPTIIVMLILRMGSVMTVGFEKIILLYNPLTMDTADVISSYVYRRGLVESNFSYSTAVGLFNSVVNCILLFTTNFISKRGTGESIW
ncbi:MAG: sugar ABC transporter permease [Clostridia bacterium]|nr:sugar ABC transporter permease [Clostridia bacterium]MCI9086646.1 sugar ABC transporter permease [Clostridia bacterium]